MMFAGLMSRWTMPLACAASSASASCGAILERLGDRQRPCRDARVEGRAVDELHRDERRAVVLVDLVDRDDVRVIEGGGARASWTKRRWRSGSAVASAGSILIATARPSRVSRAE